MYIVVCSCVPVLRRKSAAASPFTVPGGVAVPLAGVLTSGWLSLQVDLDAILLSLAFVIAGSALYLIAYRKQSTLRAEALGLPVDNALDK
jgi:hypothetical protein